MRAGEACESPGTAGPGVENDVDGGSVQGRQLERQVEELEDACGGPQGASARQMS